MKNFGFGLLVVSTGVLALIIVLAIPFWAWPQYNIWASTLSGEAALKHAEYERQTRVVEAKANYESQKYNADSEVVRANGVSKANNIIKNSITDQYIRYLWVQTLDKGSHDQIIYVPTEMGLPITEAGRGVTPSK
jgi:hypothetical protein